jgi:hypothetical protein
MVRIHALWISVSGGAFFVPEVAFTQLSAGRIKDFSTNAIQN